MVVAGRYCPKSHARVEVPPVHVSCEGPPHIPLHCFCARLVLDLCASCTLCAWPLFHALHCIFQSMFGLLARTVDHGFSVLCVWPRKVILHVRRRASNTCLQVSCTSLFRIACPRLVRLPLPLDPLLGFSGAQGVGRAAGLVGSGPASVRHSGRGIRKTNTAGKQRRPENKAPRQNT